ncbi:hypothetical protein GOV04_01005 [Candidatus Woesearchaeota archaeon]|nr:hypothetical protein [Candidatus Woesearchaeota archaeon]
MSFDGRLVQNGAAVKIAGGLLAGTIASTGDDKTLGGVGVIGAAALNSQELTDEIEIARNVMFDGQGNRKGTGLLYVNIMVPADNYSELTQVVNKSDIVDGMIMAAGLDTELLAAKKSGAFSKDVIPKLGLSNKAVNIAIKRYKVQTVMLEDPTRCGGHTLKDQKEFRAIEELLEDFRSRDTTTHVVVCGGITNDNYQKIMPYDHLSIGNGLPFFVTQEAIPQIDWTLEQLSDNETILFRSCIRHFLGRAIKNKFIKQHFEQNSEEVYIAKNRMSMSEKKCPTETCLSGCKDDFCIYNALINSSNGQADKGIVFTSSYRNQLKPLLEELDKPTIPQSKSDLPSALEVYELLRGEHYRELYEH